MIPDNLNDESYIELLEHVIDPRITQILEGSNILLGGKCSFQQDGAPSHFALFVRQFLDNLAVPLGATFEDEIIRSQTGICRRFT